MVKDKKKYNGLTLIETLMAILIFWIGIQGFTMLFIRSWQSNSYILEMGQSSLAVSQGLNKAVVYLRQTRQADNGAYPIKSAAANDLVVYSDYDKDDITERLHFYKNGSQLIMGITKPTSDSSHSYAADDQSVQIIASNIVNETNVPIFYYYNNNYPGDQANNPLTSPVAVSNVRLIKILLKININPNRAPDNIQLESFAELRNLNH